ncbi:nickel pincer cofactor biosynthesis protein LarC [Frankia sp. Mgl5]|uniref:nickel pincer cofactor biosynthesis protein LarC n=1 Tax=Frankia sp. Mgl5 TaxID=2933793 RepID=UPI00200D0A94|nr:nickel pincer cofactor biosynthesis protein LarC [Frankia sp. Mgl5]MCK9932831.1 nickel pincer cofactor biosynthesis protein LarC [Frankia sp. Mgl5]
MTGNTSTGVVGWLDATGGISGDMLLGACLDAGVDLAVLRAAVAALRLPDEVRLDARTVQRGGLRASQVLVRCAPSPHARGLGDILGLLDAADLDPVVRARAADVFRALGAAEARVHGRPIEQVHFHEVGALDSLADVVGAVAGLHALGIDWLVCSPISLGGGRINAAHGAIPLPGPAVLELLRAAGAPASGGPVETELATPTGVALAVTLAEEFGPMPLMRTTSIGLGAGGRDLDGHPNVTRLVVGRADLAGPAAAHGARHGDSVVLETNVDDLDPRLWPSTLRALLAGGAADAWLTPILMKKGRPAHVLSVLCEPAATDRLRQVIFSHTTSIGVREHTVTKSALARRELRVAVAGGEVRVKVASSRGAVVNTSVEYDDVVAVAAAAGLPPKVVLDLARAEAARAHSPAAPGNEFPTVEHPGAHGHGRPGQPGRQPG